MDFYVLLGVSSSRLRNSYRVQSASSRVTQRSAEISPRFSPFPALPLNGRSGDQREERKSFRVSRGVLGLALPCGASVGRTGSQSMLQQYCSPRGSIYFL